MKKRAGWGSLVDYNYTLKQGKDCTFDVLKRQRRTFSGIGDGWGAPLGLESHTGRSRGDVMNERGGGIMLDHVIRWSLCFGYTLTLFGKWEFRYCMICVLAQHFFPLGLGVLYVDLYS